jgi:hypothetical protein
MGFRHWLASVALLGMMDPTTAQTFPELSSSSVTRRKDKPACRTQSDEDWFMAMP